jgi:uncharacterized protein (TIGR03067 family)
MRRLTLLLLASLSLAFAPAPFGKADTSKADLKRLQGTWQLVAVTNGKNLARIGDIRIVIAGNDVTVQIDGNVFGKWSFTLDAGKRPKAIDLTETVWETKRDEGKGIYSLDGDTLRICWGKSSREADRPKDLKRNRPSQCLEVYKRVKR